MNQKTSLVKLGKTDIEISQIGTGAWQWGDRMMWGYGNDYQLGDVQAAFDASLDAGINFFDSAEAYGQGKSERFLGSFMAGIDKPIVVATKFMPYPWRFSKGALIHALRNSLKRLGRNTVELYQIHWPMGPKSIESWADALAEAVQSGLTHAVGVSNYSEAQMRRAYSHLAKHGIPLASNQMPYSLLNRQVEFNGLLKTCQELNITLIAYSPLEKGMLTGKYSSEKLPQGFRSRRYNRAYLEKIQPLIRKLGTIAREHGDKTVAQVALNWLIAKGAVPIPGAKNAKQANENAAAMGWRLDENDVATLDELSEQYIE